MKFGEYLRQLRQERNWKLEDVENKSGIPSNMICDFENGRRPPPGDKLIYKLALAFEVPFNDLKILSLQEEIPEFDLKKFDRSFKASAFYSEIDPAKLPPKGMKELKDFYEYLLQKYGKEK